MLIFGMIFETGVVLRLNKRQTRHIFRVVRKISYVQKNVPRGGHFFLPRMINNGRLVYLGLLELLLLQCYYYAWTNYSLI
jgi:hypothetical protein